MKKKRKLSVYDLIFYDKESLWSKIDDSNLFALLVTVQLSFSIEILEEGKEIWSQFENFHFEEERQLLDDFYKEVKINYHKSKS